MLLSNTCDIIISSSRVRSAKISLSLSSFNLLGKSASFLYFANYPNKNESNQTNCNYYTLFNNKEKEAFINQKIDRETNNISLSIFISPLY